IFLTKKLFFRPSKKNSEKRLPRSWQSTPNSIKYIILQGLTCKKKKLLAAENIENLRKMFFAISGDVRVILIDLASRIDGITKVYLKKFISHLKKILSKERVPYLHINYRAKSYWSTYQKLLTHNMDFEKIHDLVALRVIVKDVANCYKVLGIIHKYYKPISEE